jgi:hypothetical protein
MIFTSILLLFTTSATDEPHLPLPRITRSRRRRSWDLLSCQEEVLLRPEKRFNAIDGRGELRLYYGCDSWTRECVVVWLCVTKPKVDDVTEVDGYISESEETGREKQRRGKTG